MATDNPDIDFYTIRATGAPLQIQTAEPQAFTLQIWDEDGKPIVTVHRDHTVTIHDDEKVNDAARIFWEGVQNYGMARCVVTHSAIG